jgi:membrane-bound lytic murein transglycosylase D
MNRVIPLVALTGLAACASAPRTSVAPAPAPEVAAAPVTAPAADTPAVRPAPPATTAPEGAAAVRPPAARSPADPPPRDDTLDVDFLDSLRSLATDTGAAVHVDVAREEVRQEAASLFGGQPQGVTWDIDVASYADHERVQYWMNYFTGRSRWHFERYLERLGRYDSMIRTRLAAAGLPRDMIYLAMIESGFNQNAVSRSGAVGVWQFMPATGRLYGLEVSTWVDDRRDPYRATDAAIRFLSDLNNRFGSLYLAAAAYNGGPGRVQRGLRRGDFDGVENRDQVFFAMAEDHRTFRRETRDYVPKLIAAALLAKEPERYGFTHLEPWGPLVYDSTVVGFQVGLDVVARLAGTTRDVIEDLNPRFHRGVTPPDRRVWLKLPPGTGDTVAARLADLPPTERVTLVVHFVSRGETLSGISRRYHVSVADIRSANRLSSSRIFRGQRLVIPMSASRASRTAGTTARSATRPATKRSASAARSSTTRSSAARPAAPRGATPRRMHVVREGETLGGIAERFGVPLSSLLNANGLTSRSVIRPGQSLRIPN